MPVLKGSAQMFKPKRSVHSNRLFIIKLTYSSSWWKLKKRELLKIRVTYLMQFIVNVFFLISQQRGQSQSGVSEGNPFNIYHDSNIQEVVKVKPVLKDLMARVHELLAEWPRHPTLLQVNALYLSWICESWYVINLVLYLKAEMR